jgi:hypothetical protein
MSVGAGYVFDRTFTIDNASGVPQFVAVVAGAEDGGCALPAGANAAKFLGFTQTAQATQNKAVSVRRLGVSAAVANGPINFGDRLVVASAAGDVKSVESTIAAGLETPATEWNVVGRAENTTVNTGDTVYVFVLPETVPLAAS